MQKILLTGASGFLGGIIYNHLKNDLNIDVITLGRDASNDIVQDISDKGFTLPAVKTVIHAAGKAHTVPKTAEEAKMFMDVNLEGTKNLCKAIEKLSTLPSNFIFISTVAVYGVDKGEMINEEAPLNGKSPYAISKIEAEDFLTKWASLNKVNLSILRLPLVAGPNAPGNLGAMINGIKTGRYISIRNISAHKSMVWAHDVAKLIPQLDANIGAVNLTDGYNPTFSELELVIVKKLNRNKPISIPYFVAKILGKTGDLIGGKFPVNSDKINKITSTLTFDDTKLRKLGIWNPSNVLDQLSKFI
ncbi:MAG: NAD-dependent epimerase/dehydratase family protein [Bacteroidota bacterium]